MNATKMHNKTYYVNLKCFLAVSLFDIQSISAINMMLQSKLNNP